MYTYCTVCFTPILDEEAADLNNAVMFSARFDDYSALEFRRMLEDIGFTLVPEFFDALQEIRQAQGEGQA